MSSPKPHPKPDADARKAAEEYQAQQRGEEMPARQPPRSEAEWRDLISNRIEEAMRAGAFDNLPGHGKPLNLDRNPYAPEGSELAFDLLKNNNLAPAWIGLRTELLRDIERWRARLAEVVGRPAAGAPAVQATPAAQAALRQGQKDAWQLEIEALNRRIVNLNLQQPIAHLELLQLRLADELRRAGAPEW